MRGPDALPIAPLLSEVLEGRNNVSRPYTRGLESPRSFFERRRWGRGEGDSRSSIPLVSLGAIWGSSLIADCETIALVGWLSSRSIIFKSLVIRSLRGWRFFVGAV